MSVDALSALEDEVFNHVFQMNPQYAVRLGLHEYDGLLPSYENQKVQDWILKGEELIRKLNALDTHRLGERRALDRELLLMGLERIIFDSKELVDYREDPLTYTSPLNVQSYIVRDYAPPENRVRAIIKHLRAIPAFLRTAQENLSKTLPKPNVRVAIEVLKGTPSNFKDARSLLDNVPSDLRTDFQEAEARALEAINNFSKALQESYLPQAKEDFALGAEKLAKLMWVLERVDMPLDQVLEMGLRDIEKNKAEFIETARKLAPGKSPRDALSSIDLDHSTAETLISDTASLLEEIRQYIVDHSLVSIPSEDRCTVMETPAFYRVVVTAAMDSPGPFETGSTQAFYYVTPVDASWSKKQKEEWLRYLNTASLKNISIHEAYPGHYVHFLHLKRLQTKASKSSWSYAFGEGWAHYCEEMLLEQGYGDLKLKLAQLRAALIRDCRYVCAIKMHTRRFTLEGATKYFMENAFFDQLPAEREALRGTFDPGYYSYTLGKLFIKRVKAKYFATHPNASVKTFHDAMMAWGAPPVGRLERLLS